MEPSIADPELDVRVIPRSHKHSTIFATFDALARQESFVLVNDHDPLPLRGQFDREHPRGYAWEYLSEAPEWRIRIRITKLAEEPMPRLLAESEELAATTADADAFGAIWKLDVADRDLDANVIPLAPGESVESHAGPDLDVLVLVIAGSGHITTELDEVPVRPGSGNVAADPPQR